MKTASAPSLALRASESRAGVSARQTSALRRSRNLRWPSFLFFSCPACSSKPAEKEPAVPVQVATVEKNPPAHGPAQAVLFPLQQAAITPKISAPVKVFLNQAWQQVRKGQLLASA